MTEKITITEVTTKKEFNRFFEFPYSLFKDDKMWVPQLLSGEKNYFNPKKNPVFEYCSAKLFLAYQKNKVVGRIAGIINNKVNEVWAQKRIRFGWLDFIENKEVAFALLNAVEEWGKTEGLNEIVGPMGFSNMDKAGMKVNGFEIDDPMSCYYNPAYYPKIMEEIGYVKDVDSIQYLIPGSQPVPEKVLKINNLIKEKYKLKIVKGLSKKELAKRYGIKLFETINKTHAHLYGYLPLSEELIHYYINQNFPFLDLNLICFIVDENDDIVGYGISMPSFVKALRKCRGKMFPFGWFHFLKALKNYDTIDLLLTGVTPEWQNKGVHSLYHAEMNKKYIELGVKMALSNPQLESNEAHRIWQKYDSKIAICRRIYIKRGFQ
jgi:GNAT superfamily N-acetyltransferase